MPPPSQLLPNRDDILQALQHPGWMANKQPDPWLIKSQWLCDLLNDYEAHVGYPYNASFQRWLEQREGWSPSPENGSPLSRLIYNAQRFRRSDSLRMQGWEAGTPALLAQAYNTQACVEVLQDSAIGGQTVVRCRVREIGGRLYAVPPRRRTHHLSIETLPCRLVAGEAH